MRTQDAEKVLNFIKMANVQPQTLRCLADFLKDKFLTNPKDFYKFVKYFKKQIQNIRNKELKKDLAAKYLNSMSPFCERLNIYKEKKILDDIALRILEPERYERIAQNLEIYKKRSHQTVKQVMSVLKKLLKSHGCDCCIVKGRYKSIYSISRKIKDKDREPLELRDIFGFRIIVKDNTVDKCFEILHLLHDEFDAQARFFNDYINVPKINGYQSLHTGLSKVLPNLDIPIEVQIRTQEMDDFAEHGFAAHWLYELNKKASFADRMQYLNSQTTNAFVYFFSHKNDLFKLPEGATVKQFAYYIHSELGSSAKYALINGKKQDLEYVLQEGDKVEICK